MKRSRQLMVVCGLALGSMGYLCAQSKSDDAAALREAIRFQRAKDAADRRQLAKEARHPSVVEPRQSGEANRRAEDTSTVKDKGPKK